MFIGHFLLPSLSNAVLGQYQIDPEGGKGQQFPQKDRMIHAIRRTAANQDAGRPTGQKAE
jgi:hypothetical protein